MGYIALTRFGLASTAPSSPSSQASFATKRTNQTLFNAHLEKRFHDLRKGHYDATDRAVDFEIAQRDAAVHTSLSSTDPSALQRYSSLMSGLTYSRSARIVSSVEHTIRSLSNIPTKEEAQAETDKIVEAFSGDNRETPDK